MAPAWASASGPDPAIGGWAPHRAGPIHRRNSRKPSQHGSPRRQCQPRRPRTDRSIASDPSSTRVLSCRCRPYGRPECQRIERREPNHARRRPPGVPSLASDSDAITRMLHLFSIGSFRSRVSDGVCNDSFVRILRDSHRSGFVALGAAEAVLTGRAALQFHLLQAIRAEDAHRLPFDSQASRTSRCAAPITRVARMA